MDIVKQYEIYWVSLDPTMGSEIKKTMPCLIISPNVSNNHLNTVLIAPLTSTIRKFPMRMAAVIENKRGQIAFDQIRCIDEKMIGNKIAGLKRADQDIAKKILKEYLID